MAIAVTTILASMLSMMIVPVMNVYNTNRTKTQLAQASSSRLADIAFHLRAATGIYLASNAKSFQDISTASASIYQYYAVRNADVVGLHYGIALANKNGWKSYLYPELKYAEWSDESHPTCKYPEEIEDEDLKEKLELPSNDYQNSSIFCPSNEGLIFRVKNNPDDGNRVNVIEITLTLKKGDVTYEGKKTIVCENLVIDQKVIYEASFNANAVPKNAASVGKTYRSVWFSKKD